MFLSYSAFTLSHFQARVPPSERIFSHTLLSHFQVRFSPGSCSSISHFVVTLSGEGPSGEVFVGRWRSTPVAVKVFKAGKQPSMSKMTAELNALYKLRHPHLVREENHLGLAGNDRECGRQSSFVQPA